MYVRFTERAAEGICNVVSDEASRFAEPLTGVRGSLFSPTFPSYQEDGVESTIGVALLGRGTVGASVEKLLEHRRGEIERRSDVRYRLAGIASRERDPFALIDDRGVDLLIEAIGGTGVALECIERALELRKHVVTANKDALATQGPRLRALAAAKGVSLRYEAAVAGAIPILGTIDGALAAEEVREVSGVLSGTCNFILDRMREGRSARSALSDAQQHGYAEADPRTDVDGLDAAHKLAILMQHAFGAATVTRDIAYGGIEQVTTSAVRRARQHGYEIKLLALARRSADALSAQVGPVLVPFNHPFAAARGVENIVQISGTACGTLTLRGEGAGGPAAASAVLGDVVAALRTIRERRFEPARVPYHPRVRHVQRAFEQFPVFAGYPIIASQVKGETHVGYSSRTLSAV